MLSITPTKLNDYLTCPLKFKLKHIQKKGSFSPSAAFAFGTSMHRTLQELHTMEKMPKDSAVIEELLERFWDESAYKSRDESKSYFHKGILALENYCDNAFDINEKTLGTEVYMSLIFAFNGMRFRLGCKVDRIALHADNSLEIIDYKTNASGKVPTADSLRADVPTFLYYALTKLTYPQYKDIKITFLNVLTMAKVSIKYEKPEFNDHREKLREILKGFADERFQPNTSEACAWCDFQGECPAVNRVVDYAKFRF
jgi:putative RecB family exonuclease